MTKEQLYESMGDISEKHITAAENGMKAGKKSVWVKWGAAAACLCLVIIGVFVIKNILSQHASNDIADFSEGEGAGTLLGAGEIYPTLMVNNCLYEWHKGAAILDSLPEGSVYYGEVVHVDGETPANDREFVSVFPASGQIYTEQGNEDCVYVVLTTSWLSDRVVRFDLCRSISEG